MRLFCNGVHSAKYQNSPLNHPVKYSSVQENVKFLNNKPNINSTAVINKLIANAKINL